TGRQRDPIGLSKSRSLVCRISLSNSYLWTMPLACKRSRARNLVATGSPFSLLPLEHGDEETVGAVPCRREEQRRLAAVGRVGGRCAHALRPQWAPGQRCELRMVREELVDLVAVLLRQHRAGGVSEP